MYYYFNIPIINVNTENISETSTISIENRKIFWKLLKITTNEKKIYVHMYIFIYETLQICF